MVFRLRPQVNRSRVMIIGRLFSLASVSAARKS
jgi:hypothetical protein